MNVNFNLAASASHWANYSTQKTETTGTIAHNNNPVFSSTNNTETAGAVAMFGGTGGASNSFSAVA